MPEPRTLTSTAYARGASRRWLVGSDDLPDEANRKAAADITACLEAGALHPRIARRYPLERIAEAHEAIEGGQFGGRVILDIG